jgi:O-antigen ligase
MPELQKNTSTTIPQISSPDKLWQALLLISIAFTIAIISITNNVAAGASILGMVILLMFIKQPELALAILFNGTIIYFYLLYKLGLETSRITTAAFYLALDATALLGSVLIISRQKQHFRPASVDILFVCFFLYVFLSYFFFSTKHEDAQKKISYAPLLVIGPYFAARLLSSEKAVYSFFKYCVIMAAILIILSFYELFFNPIFENDARFSAYKFSNRINNPILFGLTFGILLIIVGTWILEKNDFNPKYLILIIPSIFLMVRAGSRGALLSFIITLFFYFSLLVKTKMKTKLSAVIIIILLFLFAYYLIPETTLDFYKSTFDYRYIPKGSVSQRFTMWQQALNDFISNSVFGIGVGNSVWGCGFPHNIILEVAAELGLVGLLMLFAICYLSMKNAMLVIRKTTNPELRVYMKISLLLFIYFFVEALFSGYITNQIQLFISIALISCITKSQENKSKPMKKSYSPGSKFQKLQRVAIQNSLPV